MDDGYMDGVQVPFRLSHNISLVEDGGGALDGQRKFYSVEPLPALIQWFVASQWTGNLFQGRGLPGMGLAPFCFHKVLF